MTTHGTTTMSPAGAIPRGWYPDPADDQRQRYFDGTSWTAHTAPRPEGAPGPGRTGPPPRRRARLIAGVVLVAVVTGVIVMVAVLRGPQTNEPVDFPTISIDREQDEPALEVETVNGGEFTAGADIEGAIVAGQRWQATMHVPEDSLILLDARPLPAGGADLTMFAYDDDGEQVAGNDDRGELSRIGGADLDPVLVLGAPPGSVEIAVGTWLDESSAEFVVHTIVPEQIGTEFDETWEVEAHAAQVRTVEVQDSGSYLFEVIAPGGAHGFFIDTNSGEVSTWRSGAEHIAEERQVEPGTHLLIVSRDALDAGELRLRITPV